MFSKAKHFLILFMEASSASIILQNIGTFCTLPLSIEFLQTFVFFQYGLFYDNSCKCDVWHLTSQDLLTRSCILT